MKLNKAVSLSILAFGLLAATPVLAHDLVICKDSSTASPVTGTFTFTVNGQQFQVAVGSCTSIIGVGTGPITITEQAVAGVAVTAINISGAASIITSDPANRTATVTVPEGGITTVRFVNVATVLGRFTGGGSILPSGGRVTHGFELHCSTSDLPNTLEINFSGNQFHLDSLNSATCTVDSTTGIATITGTGTGTFNGAAGYTIQFTLTDAGEPGTNDFASYVITSPSMVQVLNAAGNLDSGNQQFHPEKK